MCITKASHNSVFLHIIGQCELKGIWIYAYECECTHASMYVWMYVYLCGYVWTNVFVGYAWVNGCVCNVCICVKEWMCLVYVWMHGSVCSLRVNGWMCVCMVGV